MTFIIVHVIFIGACIGIFPLWNVLVGFAGRILSEWTGIVETEFASEPLFWSILLVPIILIKKSWSIRRSGQRFLRILGSVRIHLSTVFVVGLFSFTFLIWAGVIMYQFRADYGYELIWKERAARMLDAGITPRRIFGEPWSEEELEETLAELKRWEQSRIDFRKQNPELFK